MPTEGSPFVVPTTTTTVSATVDLTTLVARVRKLTLDEPYEDFLTANLDGSSGSVTVNAPTSWAEGDIMEARDSTLEQMKVRTGGANPVVVKRAHNDTTAAAHSSGITILKNPRFTGDEISEALTRVCYNSWPQVWQTNTATISPVATTHLYALPSDVFDLVDVTQDTSVSSTQPSVFHYGTNGYPVSVQQNVPPNLSSTGMALYLPCFYQTTSSILVTYRTLLTITDVPEGIVADAIVMGAVARILGMRQVQRSGIDVRQAEPGLASAYLQDTTYFQQEYLRLLRLAYLELLKTSAPMALWRS